MRVMPSNLSRSDDNNSLNSAFNMSMDSLKRLLLRYKLIIPLPTYPVVRFDVCSPLRRYSHPENPQHPALYIHATVVLVYNSQCLHIIDLFRNLYKPYILTVSPAKHRTLTLRTRKVVHPKVTTLASIRYTCNIRTLNATQQYSVALKLITNRKRSVILYVTK